MNKKIKNVFIVSLIIFIVGGLCLAAGIHLNGKKYLSQVYGISILTKDEQLNETTNLTEETIQVDEFKSIQTDLLNTKLELVEAEENKVVTRIDKTHYDVSVSVENDTLILKMVDKKPNVSDQSFNKIIIYSQNVSDFENVELKSAYCQTSLTGIKADSIKVAEEYSELSLTDGSFNNFELNQSYCDTELKNIHAKVTNMAGEYNEWSIESSSSDNVIIDSAYCDVDIDGQIKLLQITGNYDDYSIELNDIEKYGFDIRGEYNEISIGEKEYQNNFMSNTMEQMVEISTDYSTIEIE